MKFTLQCKHLLKPLQQLNTLLHSRPALPILSNLLLQVTKDSLLLTSTDLEMEIVAHIILFQPYDEGKITISARKFFDICRSLPENSEILVELKENHVSIYSGRSRFLLSTLPALDFPSLDNWKSKIEFSLPQRIMKYLIRSTQFSMANQDVRYYLNGMLFEVRNKEIRTVATDGHRLAVCSVPISDSLPNYSVIIPRKGVIELMRMISWINKPMCMQIGSHNIRIHLDSFIFTSKLVSGHFPDYRCLLVKNSSQTLEVNCDAFTQGLSRAAIFSNEKIKGVHLYITENQIKIFSRNSENEEVEEILDATYLGPEIEVYLNANYVLDVLNVLKCKKVRITLIDSVSRLQIEDTMTQSAIYIIMPMRL